MRLAVATNLLLACVATWPFVLDPAGGLVGHPGNDVWNHVWGYWWVAREVGAGRLPLHTDLQGFPGTHALFFIDTFGALWTLPFQWIAGPVVAYNVSVFAGFFVAGLGAWALARHLLAQAWGAADADGDALYASVALALSPHLLAQAYNGISETLTAGGLPLATLAMLRVYERPTAGRTLAAGAIVALVVTANWYYGLFAAIAAALLLILLALTRRERIHWRRVPLAAGGAGAIAAVLVAPVLLGFSASLDEEGAIVSRDPAFVWKSLVSHNMTDVVSVFRPGKVYSPDLKLLHGEDLIIVTYVGWALLGMAVLGLTRLRRWRDRAPWLVWIGVFAVLMLGPYLYAAGEYRMIAGRKIPLPFLALFDLFPAFSRISHPFRFVVPVQLALGLLAAMGAGRIPARWRALPAVLIAAEALVASPARWPLPRSGAAVPDYYAEMAADPVPGAVLDLPITVPNLERAVYGYWQTVHGRPSPYALNEPIPAVLDRSHLARALRVAEGSRLDTLPPMLAELDLAVAGRALARMGVRYVVYHHDLYPPRRGEQARIVLDVALGPPTEVKEGGDLLWRLEPPEAGDADAAGPTGVVEEARPDGDAE